jgi:uncharacterized protein (DUF2225 family)
MSSALWNKKLSCPFCNAEFETTRLRASSIRVKEKHSDFGSVFEGLSPYFYSITACPNCSIAARNEEFEKFNAGYEPKLMEVCKKMSGSGGGRHEAFQLGELSVEQAVKRHELAITMHKFRAHSDAGELAGLYMHVAWIYRSSGNAEGEKKAMSSAATAYQEFYEKGNKLPEKLGEPGILYLIGELNRRIGNVKEGRQYFSRALTSKELGAFPNIENMLREGMLLAKDQLQG